MFCPFGLGVRGHNTNGKWGGQQDAQNSNTGTRSRQQSTDEENTNTDSLTAYRINVHNIILDTVSDCTHHCFLQHGTLYADLSLLDPLHFPDLNSNGLPHNALEDISKCLIPFDEDATVETLQSELCSLALHWDTIKKSPLSESTTTESHSIQLN